MEIERLRPESWARSRAVRLRALAEAPDAFACQLVDEEGQPEEFWRERLSGERCATLIATDAGVDLGCAVGCEWDGEPGCAGLFSMWVAPEARGRGVGGALVQAVIAWARAAGHARLLLEVADENAAAVALYARHGFEPTGRTGSLPAPREHVAEHQRALVLTSWPASGAG